MKKLKKFLLLLTAAAMPVLFASCGGDDDDNPTYGDSSLIGTWTAKGYTINGHYDTTLRVQFKSNQKGVMTAAYTDGTDPDTYNFEYTLKKDVDGDLCLNIIWTSSSYLIYQSNRDYYITVTPTRLTWGDITYIKTSI